MRVLIAEDDPVSRLRLIAILRKWGFEPVVCCDGLEALSHFEKDDPPDIALLDWMMPELDGPEVCRRIREKFPISPIYIILLTAKAQREDLIAGLAAGANDYLTKPYNQQELYARFQVGERVVELQKKLADRIEELGIAMSRLHFMQQTQKLEALGQMSSGIAHEINTPTQYIGENIGFLQDSWPLIRKVLERETDNLDIAYLLKEVPKAIDESLQGIHKVSTIVRAMRDFSHPAVDDRIPVDINRAVETSVTVATTHWRYTATVETQFADLPTALCFPAEIHQLLFNLIVNAADAIADAGLPIGQSGKIRISTTAADGWIEIRVADNGTGIPEEHRKRVFDPFFTTKEIGLGTGQGLANAHSIVVQQHHGEISFETETGRGTTFIVRLPVDGKGENRNELQIADTVR